MNYRSLFLSLALLVASFITTQAQLSVSGELRTRGMVDHGYSIPVLKNTNADYSVDQRTRLNLNYKSSQYTFRLSFQDARIWGSDDLMNKAGTWGNSASFGLHEAWVDIKLGAHSHMKVGRQEWNYDNMKILSYRNWATAALAYDGLLLQSDWKDQGLRFDIGLSYNNNGNQMAVVDNSLWQMEKQKSMNFVRVEKSLGAKTSASLILSLSAKTDTSNNAVLGTGTHGFNILYNKSKQSSDGVFASLEAYYQHGTDLKRASDGAYKDISAYLFTGEFGFRTLNKKLELSLGAELISGHDYSNTDSDYNNTRHTFDLQYGGRFPFYGGAMNHFTVQESFLTGTKGGGYFDPYVKARYKFNRKNILEAALYMPYLTTDVKAHTGVNTSIKKPVGNELDANANQVYWKGSMGQYVDLAFTRKFSKEIVVKTGFSYAFVSDIKNQMVNGYKDVASKELHDLGNNYFGWVMLVLRPDFEL